MEISHSHYLPETLALDVVRGDRVHTRTTMRVGQGTLSLLSNPRGAWVELNGQRLEGVTPMAVDVPSGPAAVRMGLTERRVAEQQVIVLTGKTVEVNLSLNIDPHGSLTVDVSPADARVRLPELDVDYVPGVRIPMGEQLIEVSRPGYETQSVRYDVRYGDNRTSIRLTRALTTLRIQVQPPRAAVSLTYEQSPGVDKTVVYKPGMRLPVGEVEISARAIGYRTAYRAIGLTAAGASLTLELQPMEVTAGEVRRDALSSGGTAPAMVVIPPGNFIMGDPQGPPSMQPATNRTLSQPFAVSVNEVTIGEFRRFAEVAGIEMDERLVNPKEPVRYVKWSEAVAYTDWLTRETGNKYRLLTEAEWEYMARAGTDTDYWFGDEIERLCEFANLADLSTKQIYREWAVTECDDGYGKLAPVGSYPANPFGVNDVHGNVSEWVLECGIPSYSTAADDGSRVNDGQSCSTHGVRGGSWDSQPEALRSRRRGFGRHRGDDRGIRLLKEL